MNSEDEISATKMIEDLLDDAENEFIRLTRRAIAIAKSVSAQELE